MKYFFLHIGIYLAFKVETDSMLIEISVNFSRDDEIELCYPFSWERGNDAEYKFLAKSMVARKALNL